MKKVTLERVMPLYKDFKQYESVSYTPAHTLLDIKFSHTFIVLRRYDETHNKTYFWIHDDGMCSLFRIFGLITYEDKEGMFFKLSGEVKLNDLISNKKFESLLLEMYNEREAKYEARRAARKAEEAEKEEEDNINKKVEELLNDRPFDKLYNEVVGKPLTAAQA